MKNPALLKPPTASMTALEARTVIDAVTMLPSLFRAMITKPHSQKRQRVLVVPGFGADDNATWPLRKHLASLGYQSMGWGLGTNKAGLNWKHTLSDLHSRWKFKPLVPYRGEAGVPYMVDRLIERIDALVNENSQPIALIGWSLGGLIAREVARERPDSICQVITLGAPVIGGPKYTLAAPSFARRRYNMDWVEAAITDREVQPITVPIKAIVSPTDGVVGYLAALDQYSPEVEHIHVDVAHIGLPYNRTVWTMISQMLAALELSNRGTDCNAKAATEGASYPP